MSIQQAWARYMDKAREREMQVVRAYVYHESQRATALALGLHPSTVCRIFQRIGKRVGAE